MKVTKSAEKITPFGGFNFVFKTFLDSGLSDLIDKRLGMRVKNFGFSYSDIFLNHLAVFFNGGDCTEDANDHLRELLQNVRGMRVCSADTILRGIKELATDTLYFENPDSGVGHEFNLNPKLNDLMVKALIQTGQLKKGKLYDLDYDNQVQPTEKYDALKTYKMVTSPGPLPLPIAKRDRLFRYTSRAGTATARQNTFRPPRFQGLYRIWGTTGSG